MRVAVGLISGSSGLIADGIHSLSDLVADFLVLFVSAHSKSGADERHPYGHQRFENAASLALGLLMAAVGIGMLWSAVIKIEHHETIPKVEITALYVAAAALVAKEMLFRYMLAVAKRVKSSMLVANAWHALRCGLLPGCGLWHYRQSAGIPHPRSGRGPDRRLDDPENGLGIRVGSAARPDGPIRR
jgi:cation diffusion facilitator family transporter